MKKILILLIALLVTVAYDDGATNTAIKIVVVYTPADIVYVDDDFNSSTHGWGYDHFDSIQDGIDTVTENGTVYVYNGTYYENVVVNKTINLIGEDRNNTIINGSGYGVVVDVSTDWVNVTGFTIRNSMLYGIYLYSSNYSIISRNIIINNDFGIVLSNSSYNEIINNNFSNSFINLATENSANYNLIYHNNFIKENAFNVADSCNNYWDNGYPSGGNYWDDHPNLVDEFSGPNQDIPGSDGIVDTPYDIPSNSSQDHYPFMNPWMDEPNNPPNTPSNPSPLDGATGVDTGASLSWTGDDPDGDPVTYDVYFGTTNPPTMKVSTNQSGTTYDPDTLDYEETYYWQIIAWDNIASASGSICSFTSYNKPDTYVITLTVTGPGGSNTITTSAVILHKLNIPPTSPEVTGEQDGTKNTSYNYTAVSTDLDNDTIQYIFDWGDDTNTMTDFVANGTAVTEAHNWSTWGIYTIKVKAYDNNTYSGTTDYIVLIDVLYVKNIGYLIDTDSDDTYDSFYSNETLEQTSVEKLANGSYLINSDSDAEWDYIYDPVTDELTSYVPPSEPENYTIYYTLIIGMLLAILILIILFLVTKKKKKKQ